MTHSESSPHKTWFYRMNDRQHGPVSEDEMLELFENRTIGLETWVWGKDMSGWMLWGDTPLYQARCGEVLTPPPFHGPRTMEDRPLSVADFEAKMEGWYFHSWLWIVIGVPLLVILVGIFPLLVANVFRWIILYHAWKLVPENKIGVPPLLAVLFMLIPIFGDVWTFWAYYFFSKEMNRSLAEKNSRFVVDESLMLIYCIIGVISSILMIVPYLPIQIFGLIILGFESIIAIFVAKSIKDGAIEIYQLKHGGAR